MKSLLFLFSMLPISAFSLEVLYELENSISASKYSLIEKEIKSVDSKVVRPKDKTFPQVSLFSAGNQEEKDIKSILLLPSFFVVGFDSTSLEWLEANAKKLKKMHAMGFVGSVENREDLNKLQEIYEGPFVVTDIDDLMKSLKINHYPFLLLSNRVYQ